MAKLLVQYLSTCNNENMPIGKKIPIVGSKFCHILSNPQKMPNTFIFLPKRLNFPKSSHTDSIGRLISSDTSLQIKDQLL